jgi:hypothetical protein
MILNQFPADLQLEMLMGSFLAVNASPLEIQNSGGRKYIILHHCGTVGLTSNKQLASLIEHIESLFEGVIKKESGKGLKRQLLQNLVKYKQILETQVTSKSVHPSKQQDDLRPPPILI